MGANYTRSPMRRRLLVLLPVCALLLGGCSFFRGLFGKVFEKPTLTFKSADLASISLADATVNLTYTLKNPNSLGLSLSTVQYAFFVEGKQVVAGQPPKGMEIPSQGQTDLVF